MAIQFDCPSCGASVRIRKNEEQVECPYCGSTVYVPREPGSVRLPATGLPDAGKSCRSVAIVVVATTLVGVAGVLVFLLSHGSAEIAEGVRSMVSTGGGGVEPVLSFGGEGMAPGRFDDPRNIAVDADGNIYVCEYTGGRVQVFDPEGGYVTEWNVKGEDVYVGGMDCSRDGRLYMAYGGDVWIHDGMTGELVDVLQWGDGYGLEDVCIASDGSAVAAWTVFEDDIIRYTPQGDVDLEIMNAISGQTGDSELQMKLAVDGQGNIYALGTFNGTVVRYTPDGRYTNRFGSDEDVPGGFTAPEAIVADATGRILISDFDGIMIYDGNGLYLDTIPVDGFVFGMDVDDDNMLYAVSNSCMVYVFDLDALKGS